MSSEHQRPNLSNDLIVSQPRMCVLCVVCFDFKATIPMSVFATGIGKFDEMYPTSSRHPSWQIAQLPSPVSSVRSTSSQLGAHGTCSPWPSGEQHPMPSGRCSGRASWESTDTGSWITFVCGLQHRTLSTRYPCRISSEDYRGHPERRIRSRMQLVGSRGAIAKPFVIEKTHRFQP